MNNHEIMNLANSIIKGGYNNRIFDQDTAALMLHCVENIPDALEGADAVNYDLLGFYSCEAGVFLHFFSDGEFVTIALVSKQLTDEEYDKNIPAFDKYDFGHALSLADSMMKLTYDTEMFDAVESTICIQLGACHAEEGKVRVMAYAPNMKMLLEDVKKDELLDLLGELIEGLKDARA